MTFFWDFLDRIFNFELLFRYGPRLFSGVLTTLELVFTSFFLGLVFAVGLCAASLSRNGFLLKIAQVFIYFFRGTPLLAQLFLIYYGSSQIHGFLESIHLWGFFQNALFCVILAFTLNTAAYQAEILRGSVLTIPTTQFEAASALGLSPLVTLFFVTIPQALMTSLRPLGNEFILLVKGSAIASLVTVYDIMGTITLAFNRSYDFRVYIWAAIIYLVIVEAVRRIVLMAEKRVTRHLHLPEQKSTVGKLKGWKARFL
jgi:polar amino acid transport system permease protein